MSSIRNHEEIAEEVAKLQNLRTKVPPKTAFGDSNHAAIDAQIEVLNRDMGNGAIYDRWDGDEHVLMYAVEARDWLDGDTDQPPSKEWQPLAGVVVSAISAGMAAARRPVTASPFGFDEDDDDWDDEEDEDEEDE